MVKTMQEFLFAVYSNFCLDKYYSYVKVKVKVVKPLLLIERN